MPNVRRYRRSARRQTLSTFNQGKMHLSAFLMSADQSSRARLWPYRYRALMLKAIGDMCRATGLVIMCATVSEYFLK
jgi:hypothetical protein